MSSKAPQDSPADPDPRSQDSTSTWQTRRAEALCQLAVQALPVGSRARYAATWRAGLAADPAHAMHYAANVLGLVHGLRAAVPLLCRLRLHRYVTVHDTSQNLRITSRFCTRCGHFKDPWRGPQPNDSIAWAGSASLGQR